MHDIAITIGMKEKGIKNQIFKFLKKLENEKKISIIYITECGNNYKLVVTKQLREEFKNSPYFEVENID